jgi:eukaryotic-like serine/threonine-protein kinase
VAPYNLPMSLAAGLRVGCYEITGKLGAGGMGEVYRAKDTRLGRDVALKALPESVTQDPERLARFRREAQVLAALNHPHIAGIYGLEETDEHRFLVLEFVDGETLAARIERGPLPWDEAITFAKEIAEALEAAHERGIVHRDLKPANIALTAKDRVKVLDFGLARATDAGSGDSAAAINSPTITSPAMLTQVGVVLGTAAYMSPEQARGRVADTRSDIWAFGCVLFEMLAGRRAFEGDEVSDTLAAVLRSDPSWDALPPSVPPHLRTLLKGCLERNHRERISDISTALFVLKQEPPAALAVSTQAPASAWKPAWPLAALLAAGAAALGAAAGIVLWPRPSPPEVRVARFELPMTDGRVLTLTRRAVAVSPDGSHIAYTADGRIYIRPIAGAEAKPLAGADPGILPAFSPDGQSIVFWANAELKRIAIAGGVPVSVCTTTPAAPFAVVWDASGILFDQRDTRQAGIVRVSPDGGPPQPLVRFTEKDVLLQKLQLLPDGDTVLFSLTRSDAWSTGDVFVQSIRTGERKTIVEGAVDPHYLPTGHLVYLVGGTLMMRPFDVHRKEPTGGPVPVIEGVRRSGGANFAVSDSGVLAYVPGPALMGQDNVIVYDRQGNVTALPLPRGAYQHPRVSPDGKWLAVETHDGKETAISLYELSGANAIRRLTYGGNNRVPVWSADGTRVAFQSDREGDRAIFWQPVDGGPAERLTRPEAGTIHTPESWARGSDVLLFSATKDVETTLWAFSSSGRNASRFGNMTSYGGPTNAVFSPDGRWIAYTVALPDSTEGWTYVEPFPPTGTRHQIARGGRPAWARNGKDPELFFVPAPGQFMAVTVRTQPTFGFTNPINVPRRFAVAYPGNPRPYDLLPDGRFVTVAAAGDSGTQGPPRIQVVLNWFEELKRKPPSR